GPLEPFDDSMPQMLGDAGIHTHLVSDHGHYWEDGGATYHTRYTTWEFFRGQEGDPWKANVAADISSGQGFRGKLRRQDAVNRAWRRTGAELSQTRTLDAALHFLATNVESDRWLLQIELFDPHEPFFTARGADGQVFDWPGYQKVTESEARVAE